MLVTEIWQGEKRWPGAQLAYLVLLLVPWVSSLMALLCGSCV